MLNPSAEPQGHQQPHAHGYEERDASAGGIFATAAGVFFILIVSLLVVAWIYHGFQKSKQTQAQFLTKTQQSYLAQQPRYPRLQISPQVDLEQFRVEEEHELHGYGWVDKKTGVVRIPIDEAMNLLLKQGLPTRKPGTQGKAGPSSWELQMQRPNAKQPEIGGSR